MDGTAGWRSNDSAPQLTIGRMSSYAERQATASGWVAISLRRRQGDALICVVRWHTPRALHGPFIGRTEPDRERRLLAVLRKLRGCAGGDAARLRHAREQRRSSPERLDKREHLSPITAVAGSNFVGRSSRAVPASQGSARRLE